MVITRQELSNKEMASWQNCLFHTNKATGQRHEIFRQCCNYFVKQDPSGEMQWLFYRGKATGAET